MFSMSREKSHILVWPAEIFSFCTLLALWQNLPPENFFSGTISDTVSSFHNNMQNITLKTRTIFRVFESEMIQNQENCIRKHLSGSHYRKEI